MLPTYTVPTPANYFLQGSDLQRQQTLLQILQVAQSQEAALQSRYQTQLVQYNYFQQRPIHFPMQSEQRYTNNLTNVSQLNRLSYQPERVNPYRAQTQPFQFDFNLMKNLSASPLEQRQPISKIEVNKLFTTHTRELKSNEESSKINLESNLQRKIKQEEPEEREDSPKPSTSTLMPEKVSTTKKIQKNEKIINTCGHPERKHYAKAACNSCYHMYRRSSNPATCGHDPAYAKGLCQRCYLLNYYQKKGANLRKARRARQRKNEHAC